MYRIGAFSEITTTSIDTLRYYNKIGLLIPGTIDQYTSYRYYSEENLLELELIEELKSVGFSLNKIKELINFATEEDFDRRRREIKNNIKAENEKLKKTDKLISCIYENKIILNKPSIDVTSNAKTIERESVKHMNEKTKDVLVSHTAGETSGLILIKEDNKEFIDNRTLNSVILGSSVGERIENLFKNAINTMISNEESLVITDPRYTYVKEFEEKLKTKGYNVLSFDFKKLNSKIKWNPLLLIYDIYKNETKQRAMDYLESLAQGIFITESKSVDPFWENSSVNFFIGSALILFEKGDRNKINFNSIITLNLKEEELYNIETIKKYCDEEASELIKTYLSGTVLAAKETAASIVSVFKQKLQVFNSSEDLIDMLNGETISLENINKEKTAIFIHFSPEKKNTTNNIVTVLLKQIYDSIDTKEKRVNFILEKLEHLNRINLLSYMLEEAAINNIRFYISISNMPSIKSTYGNENVEIIESYIHNYIHLFSQINNPTSKLEEEIFNLKSNETLVQLLGCKQEKLELL